MRAKRVKRVFRALDLLNLPGWTTVAVQEEARLYRIVAEAQETTRSCPWCASTSIPYRFGKRGFTFTDLPMHGRQVRVSTRRQRFRCRHCQHTWLSPLPSLDEHHAVTERLIQHVEREMLSLSSPTFVSLASALGIAESSLRNLFDDCVRKRELARQLSAPRILGIDELHLLGAPRCILTDISERRVIDLLENRRLETVRAWLKHLPGKANVQAVTMDMWAQYRTAMHELLPHARIVIDAFHVLKLASSCLETVRKTIRASLPETQVRRLMHDRFLLLRRPDSLSEKDRLILESWLGGLPKLHEAYERKEEFYAIYEEATSREEAIDRYCCWLDKITLDQASAFWPLITAIKHWSEEIFNYWFFDGTITNAFTEAKNGALRACHRAGRGYSLPVIRAKVLFAEQIAQESEVKLPCPASIVSTASLP